jgi:hypothetical protein
LKKFNGEKQKERLLDTKGMLILLDGMPMIRVALSVSTSQGAVRGFA